ncbi:MAG: rod shape-determining protein MreC [Bacteroidia bacterium]
MLFLLLQGISLFALIRFNNYHQAVFFSTSSQVNGNILTQRKNVINYFSLQSENQKLKNENILLRTRGTENFIFISDDTLLAKDSAKKLLYSYIPATVIYNNIRKQKNYFTINRGYAQGVEKNMGVISPQGVAGKIVDVSENFSVAMSILNSDFILTPKIAGEVRFGKLSWNGSNPDYVQIQNVSNHYDIKVGQEVATTPFADLFPDGVAIGNISKVSKSENNKYWVLEVKLSTDMTRLGEVYIIKNLFKKELDQLQDKYINEE